MNQKFNGPQHGGGRRPGNPSATATAQAALSGERLQEVESKRIPRALIDPDSLQPRTRFDTDKLAELRASIQHDGQQSPIKVVPVGNRYRVVWGHRRYWAMDGFEFMDVIVERTKLGQQKILELQLAENIQREELSLADICRAIVRFQDEFNQPYSYLATTIFQPLAKGNPEWVGDRARAWKRADEPTRRLMEEHSNVLSHVEEIVKVSVKALRERMIDATKNGASVAEVREMARPKQLKAANSPTMRQIETTQPTPSIVPTITVPPVPEDNVPSRSFEEIGEELQQMFEDWAPEEIVYDAQTLQGSFDTVERLLIMMEKELVAARDHKHFNETARQASLTRLKALRGRISIMEEFLKLKGE